MAVERLIASGATRTRRSAALAAHSPPLPRKGNDKTIELLFDRGAGVREPVLGDGNPLIIAARGGSAI